ncbi:hypothetical protein NUH16_003488 [Penicillium rubens]|nr:hypothetical protein NUH16_003488 [Penicillium rubens]
MDHPTSPSPIDRPAKRQCRVSQAPEDEPKLENQPQQVTNGTTIEPKIPERKRAVQALYNGVVSALEASDLQASSAEEPKDYDLDLDLHAIWHESSSIPTPPPCLATDPNDLWQDSFGKDDPAEYQTQEPSLNAFSTLISTVCPGSSGQVQIL